MVAPFWWLGRITGAVKPGDLGYFNDDLLRLGGFLCGSLPLALIITLLWDQAATGQRALGRGPGMAPTVRFVPFRLQRIFLWASARGAIHAAGADHP
jgi:hypothetical protein